MSLLLSAALSFFPLWGSSSAVARLAVAERLWLHPPPEFASHPRSGLPGAAAAGRHRGRPRQWRGGAARGGSAGGSEAELGRVPFGTLPPPGLARAHKERRGRSCSLVSCQGLWEDMPRPLHVDAHMGSLKGCGLTTQDRCHPAFSSWLCAFSYAAPRLYINLRYRICVPTMCQAQRATGSNGLISVVRGSCSAAGDSVGTNNWSRQED